MIATMDAKYIGESNDFLTTDQIYKLSIQTMGGKLYNKDTGEYVKDHRIMVWVNQTYTSVLFFKVYQNEDELYKTFRIIEGVTEVKT